MPVLLIADVQLGRLAGDATAKALSIAVRLGEVDVLVAGHSVSAAAEAIASLEGVRRVRAADHESLANGLAEPLAMLIAEVGREYSHIFAPVSASAKNVMPRVAALLDVMIIADASKVIDGETFERPVYAGNALQTVRSADSIKVATLRTASAAAAPVVAARAPIETVSLPAVPETSRWISDTVVATGRPDLTVARRVVSGGRGVGSKEGFELVARLADKLEAAVGASRAAVDQGFAPSDSQVGQTGKVVAPDLYVAVGISGAIQHLAGMKDSRVIVAINQDADAPIFQIADYSLVADLFKALPELIEKL